MKEWQTNQIMTKKFDDSQPSRHIIENFSRTKSGYVLDLGCGKGKNAIWLAKNGWKVDVVDPKQKWLGIVKERSAEANIEIQSFVQSDIQSFVPDKQYDLIVCAMVLHFLSPDQITDAIEKMQSWIKPDGQIYISVMTDDNPVGHRPTLFKKGQLRDYFNGWEANNFHITTDPLLMPGNTEPEIYYFDFIIARKPS